MKQSSARVARPKSADGRDFWKRLKEIDMFFEGRGREQQTMRRLARNLKKIGVPYAIMGGMAVNARDSIVVGADEGLLETGQSLGAEQHIHVARRPLSAVSAKAICRPSKRRYGRCPHERPVSRQRQAWTHLLPRSGRGQ